MKLATFSAGGSSKLGLVTERGVVSLTERLSGAPADMVALIEGWERYAPAIAALPSDAADFALETVRFHAPIARPGKILGIGLNYADHADEAAAAGFTRPERQMWFSKPGTAVNGPFDDIERPIVSEALDYEAEMVFVVGKRCRNVAPEDAAQAIFGYCVGNDVSVRDWQFHTSQVMIGKSFDTHAPFGPWIVTRDAIDISNLAIRTLVNGEKRQESNTRYMIFDCAAMLSYLSEAMTLEPGDVVFTGTPGGVGALMKPPSWLKPGDRVRVEIDGIGAIENVVFQAQAKIEQS
jgi:2-keto-4-pentenoate hydratase/2-oxohepta-3-ene-1,7-dioic acid hydratase in catechol pathway